MKEISVKGGGVVKSVLAYVLCYALTILVILVVYFKKIQ